MITVNRRSYIEGVSPEEVFAALSDPEGVERLLPRMRKVEILSRGIDSARLATHMSMGGVFGTIRCEGNLRWVEPHEIVFKVVKPLPVETRWTLSQAVNGTELHAAMTLDLKPLLGPMAGFVPKDVVEEMVDKELENALREMAARLRNTKVKDQAIAA